MESNLQAVDVDIPRDSFVACTQMSGLAWASATYSWGNPPRS